MTQPIKKCLQSYISKHYHYCIPNISNLQYLTYFSYIVVPYLGILPFRIKTHIGYKINLNKISNIFVVYSETLRHISILIELVPISIPM